MSISSLNGIDISNIASVNDVSSIAKINGVEWIVGPGDRGIYGGGNNGSSYPNTIEYITISSTGNASDFGDLVDDGKTGVSACSNGTNNRGIFGGGSISGEGACNEIEYITISSTGNASDFGDLVDERSGFEAIANGTDDRGVFAGGHISYTSIEYITITSTGNATNFGKLIKYRYYHPGACSNGTDNRGIFGGGTNQTVNSIEYITISSTGDATVFGDLIGDFLIWTTSTSNGTDDRGVFGGGQNNSTQYINRIQYITITSTGDASDFGDLSSVKTIPSSSSNGTNDRGVFGGGRTSSSTRTNVLEYITITSTGNATNFGDLFDQLDSIAGTDNGQL